MNSRIEYFALFSSRDLRTALHIISLEPRSASLSARIYCSNGELGNSVEADLGKRRSGAIELEPLVKTFPQRHGFRYGLIAVDTPIGQRTLARLYSSDYSSFMSAMFGVSKAADNNGVSLIPGFLPKLFAPNLDTFLMLSNPLQEELVVTVKVLMRNRSPEKVFTLRPFSSELVHLESAFGDLYESEKGDIHQAYVKIRAKGDGLVLVQMLDMCRAGEKISYRSIS